MIERIEPGSYRAQFHSLLDVLDHVKNAPPKWRSRASVTTNSGPSWTLGVGWEGTLKLAHDGWEEGVRKLNALAATVPDHGVLTRELDVAGHYPDVPRALSGDPFNMITRGRQRTPKPAMTLVVSYGANCDVPANALWNYGAAIVALIDRLEARHVRVEVIACWRSTGLSGGFREFTCSHTVKRAEDALDLSAMAFSLAHPAMLRRLAFAVMERTPAPAEASHYGVSMSEIREQDLIDAPMGGALYIGGIGSTSECNTLEGALRYVTRKINAAAGEPIAELEVAA